MRRESRGENKLVHQLGEGEGTCASRGPGQNWQLAVSRPYCRVFEMTHSLLREHGAKVNRVHTLLYCTDGGK